IKDPKTASHSRTQIRFGFFHSGGVEDFDANTAFAIKFLFAVNFGHLLFVSGKPEGAAGIIFNISGKLRNELLPESAREMGESEWRLGIVHDDNGAHARRCSSTGDWTTIQDENLQTCAGAFGGASGTNDSSANDDEVEGFGHGKSLKR